MRHVTSSGLDQLEPLLSRLRTLPDLVEKKRGVFYRRSKAFIHFHEDPSGFYADVRVGPEFERYRVQTSAEQDEVLAVIRLSLDPTGS